MSSNVKWGGVKITYINYYGRKYGDDKMVFWQDADLFVFPTHYSNECFPLVNLEAMSYKLPVVSTNVGGIPDEVENGRNGLIVDPNNPSSLASAICHLLNDTTLRQKMGNESYQRFKNMFTENIFEKTLTGIIEHEIGGDSDSC